MGTTSKSLVSVLHGAVPLYILSSVFLRTPLLKSCETVLKEKLLKLVPAYAPTNCTKIQYRVHKITAESAHDGAHSLQVLIACRMKESLW